MTIRITIHDPLWHGRIGTVVGRSGTGVWVKVVEWPAGVLDDLGGRIWVDDSWLERVDGEVVVERVAA